jgi:hypothetical protein
MQHRSRRQDPMLFPVPIRGEGKPVPELEEECRAELFEVAARHLTALAGSTSPWLRFLAVIAEETADGCETGSLVRVV